MRIQRHAVIATMLGLLAAAAIVSPVSAAGTIRWVDDDGSAGPNGCGGSAAAHTTIQGGVDAAATGDTVKVCPGTYPGLVTITTAGITLTGVTPWKARVIPAPVTSRVRPAGGGGLITVQADDVRVQWLKVQTPNGGLCTLGTAIGLVDARRAQIRSNLIQGRTDADSLNCGITTAIHAQASSGWISWNQIRQYTYAGISVTDSPKMAVNRNSIRWAHQQQVCLRPACLRAAQGTGPRPAGGPGQAGIEVIDSDDVRVAHNSITVADGATQPEGGIAIYGSDVRIFKNTVKGYSYGITAAYGSIGIIRENDLTGGGATGIYLYNNLVPTAAAPAVITVLENVVRDYGLYGVRLDGAPGNLIQDNDLQASLEDCYDDAIPTDSTWVGIQGTDQNQPGLCFPEV